MSHGRRTRRTTSRFAGVVVIANLVLGLTAGCERIMVPPTLPPLQGPPGPAVGGAATPPTAMPTTETTVANTPPLPSRDIPAATVADAHDYQHVYDRAPLPDGLEVPTPAPATAIADAGAGATAEPSPAAETPLPDAAVQRVSNDPQAQPPGVIPEVAVLRLTPDEARLKADALTGQASNTVPAPEPDPEPQPLAGSAVQTEPPAPDTIPADAERPADPPGTEPIPAPEPKPVTEPQPAPAPASQDLASPANPQESAAEPARAVEPVTITPEPPVDPAPPRDPWREGLDRLRSVAHDRAEGSGDEDGPWAVRARLLDALESPEDSSASGTDEFRQTLLAALDATSGPESAARSEPIRAAVAALEERTPLEINELQLCRKVRGFGDFEPLDPNDCRVGRGVIVYCELSGVRTEPAGALFRSRLASRVELVPRGGGGAEQPPTWTQSLGNADDLCRRRRRDYYVNYRITLPDSLPPGSYELRLIQEDLIANRSAVRSIPVEIRP